jgi:hypothetical protein
MTTKTGMGFIPIFNDYSVYERLRMIANQRKQRVQTIILEAVQKRYTETTKSELTINDPAVFHKEIAERAKTGGGMLAGNNPKSVQEYIEVSCKEYVRAYFGKLSQ